MTDQKFPADECYMCDKPVLVEHGMVVRFHDLEEVYRTVQKFEEFEDALNSEFGPFLNQVSWLYTSRSNEQFPLRLMDHEAARLQFVLDHRPKGAIYLLAHDGCIPRRFRTGAYEIDLETIDTKAKADEWTQKLEQKRLHNKDAWNGLLRALFGFEE